MADERLRLRVQLDRPGFRLDVSEDIPLAGCTAIFGPSGGGKTTLLRAIAGFDRPRAGAVTCGDRTWFDSDRKIDVPAYLRPVGFMFQDARLFAHRDVAGNLDFAYQRRRRHEAAIEPRDAIAALDLDELLPRQVDSLSGGERQRVALGRTLLTSPELLLLDEPLSGLDRDRKSEILPYLEKLSTQFELPTLYVSHDIDEVARLAEHVLVLTAGRVQMHGTVAAVLERLDLQPIVGRFEAGVIVEGSVMRHDARLHLTHLDIHGETLTMPLVERVEPGGRVRVRIRARDVAIATQRPAGLSIRNVLPGTISDITAIEETGFAEVLIQLKNNRVRARLTRAACEELQLELGMPVFALIKSVSFERGG